MISIMRSRGGRLAAPQIGVHRIFVMEDTEEGMSDVQGRPVAQERPFPARLSSTRRSPQCRTTVCFLRGLPQRAGVPRLGRRYLQVRVRGYGGDGKPVDFVAKGWLRESLSTRWITSTASSMWTAGLADFWSTC